MDGDDRTVPIPGVPVDRTLMSVLAALKADGYDGDMFVTAEGKVRCGVCRHDAEPTQIELHAIRRIEGASDPADEAAVLALTCRVCGARGTAVVRYGPEAEPQDIAVLRAVEDLRT
ncbi:MAG: hypothetical protein ACRDYW_10950 [Acidimicrobiales bacterium]